MNQLGTAWAFSTSKPTSTGISPSKKPHFLTFLKQSHQLGSYPHSNHYSNHFLMYFRAAPWAETQARYCKPGQEPMFREPTSPREDSITATLLNGYIFKLHLKSMSIEPQIGFTLRLCQRSFLVLQMVGNTETHTWSQWLWCTHS
jgi:hypothetical protein